jgi:hypothetical protein
MLTKKAIDGLYKEEQKPKDMEQAALDPIF